MLIWPTITGGRARARSRAGEEGEGAVQRQTFLLGRLKWRWLSPPEKAWPPFECGLPVMHQGRLDAVTGANPEGGPPAIKYTLQANYARWFEKLRNAHAAEMANALALVAVRDPAPYDGTARMADVRSQMAALKSEHRQTLEIAFAEECEAEDEIIRFRHEHDLERSARVPEKPWILAVILIALGAVEGLFASPIFIESAGGGHRLDNILASLFVSYATIGLGVATGFIGVRYAGFRMREHPYATSFWRAFGISVAAASVTLAGVLAWHLALARLDALEAVREMAKAETVRDAVVAGTLAFLSPMTSVLAFGALTLFTFTFALVKSYSGFADPFPFYTSTALARDNARRAFQHAKEKFYAAMLDMLRGKLAGVQNDLEAEARGITDIVQIVGEAEAWDYAAREAPQAALKKRDALAKAYDGAFSTIAANRPEGTLEPEESDAGELMAMPDFRGRLEAASARHAGNQEAHRQLLCDLEGVIQEFTLNGDEEIESWRATYRNRFRPFGTPVRGEVVPFPPQAAE